MGADPEKGAELSAREQASSATKPIGDYALIGNMLSAALVATDGSIDWLCLPRFDSPPCFAALLGSAHNGRWIVAPAGPITKTTRRYRPDSAILETTFETRSGIVTVTDFMPRSNDEQRVDLIRIVTGVSGSVDMSLELILRFAGGEAIPWVRRRDYGINAVAGPDAVDFRTPLDLRGEDLRTLADFAVAAGDSVPMTLSYYPSHEAPRAPRDPLHELEQTALWWNDWIEREKISAMPASTRDAVSRSLITLRLLTYGPTGAVIAAPTTSLPERLGGARNWDYRYCWLRDSALTLYALLGAGYREEAQAWRQWLLRSIAGHPQQLQIVYGITGDRWLPEVEAPWLSGYAQSRPVRFGNAAADQQQLDVYGELIETLCAARDAGLGPEEDAWRMQCLLLEYLQENWRSADHGMWEMRGPPKLFTHSRVMCWSAFHRAALAAERHGLDAPINAWRAVSNEIHEDVCAHAFNESKNSFVQYYGGDQLDASLLLLPQVGFLPADDPRILGTIAAVERELMHDGFVRRYSSERVDDGVGGDESAFLACSFWLVDAYVLCGRVPDARALFERLLAVRNDVGLLAEEYDPATRRLRGNFPQAFSHIGLINAANNLFKDQGPARQRAANRT